MRSSRIDRSFGTGCHAIFLLLLLACLTLTGCGGGGGGGASSGSTPSGSTPSGSTPSGSSTPIRNTPTSTSVCTVTTLGCLTKTQYRARVQSLRTTHRNAGFTNNWGLNTVKVDAAWAKLQLKYGTFTTSGDGITLSAINSRRAPGDGITLGAIDTGIDTGHPVFAGKTVIEVFLQGATNEDGSEDSHGTAVAGVMAANPSQSFITQTTGARGVAWGADITMFAVPTGSGGGNFIPISLPNLKLQDHLQTGFPYLLNQAIGWSNAGRTLDFVNVSLGFRSIIDMYTKSELTSNFGNFVNALKQSGSSRKTVFVWSAGNAHGKTCDKNDFPTGHKGLCDTNTGVNAVSPGVMAGLAARFPELRDTLIAVVAVQPNGEIASFSNRCGIARDSCIAAPGVDIRTVFFGPFGGQNARRGSYDADGTSFSAPMVTGGLGLMKHFFRNQLSNAELVRRLYATAKKSGIYANRAIYGQGLMDLDAALTPVEFTTLTLGNRVNDGGKPLVSTSLNLGAAFGDGLTQSLANREIAAFDQLGAPFWYSLGSLAGTRSGPSIQSRLNKFMGSTNNAREFGIFQPALGALPTEQSTLNSHRFSLGLMDTPDLVDDGGHLSLLGRAVALNRSVSDKLDFSLFSSEGNGDQARVSGMEFVSRPSKKNFAFRSGVVAERQSLLRSSAAGAFGRMSGNSVFVGFEGNLKVGSWHLSAGAEVGTVIADIDESLLSIKSPLTTSAFAFRARTKLNERDTLNFALSQPVRIESGRAGMTIPVGRTVDGDVLKSSYSVDLEPSGRQIDLAMQWRRALPSSNGDFRLATGVSFHPGHNDAAEPTISVLAGWRLGF